jgi:putative ABC transport system permease protein
MRGLLARRAGRLLAASAGIALAVALLASLGSFLAASKATMTQRAAAGVAVDWQVQVQPGTKPGTVLKAAAGQAGTVLALPVGFADTTGLQATVGGTTQTTGPGNVLGLPPGYLAGFPGSVRLLAGSLHGVLVAQQTAANLHVQPGDRVRVGRTGLSPFVVAVAGVVELPQADSLFQHVGQPTQTQPQAPPDNVVLLPQAIFTRAFSDLAKTQPDLVSTQIHVRRDRQLPSDPSAAYTTVTQAANNLEASVAGSALVGDNLGTALGAAREDALYAQMLFLFLGVPGAVLAATLTWAVAGAGADRRRQEQSLLRSRGCSGRRLLLLAALEATTVGVIGGVIGLAGAALIGRSAFGSAGFGTTTNAAVISAGLAFVVGLGIAAATVVLPARHELAVATTYQGRSIVRRPQRPSWMRFGVDGLLLAGSLAIFWATSRSKYTLVLAPEGVPTIKVSYWAFLGPALLWAGCAMLAWRIADLVLDRGKLLVAWVLRRFVGSVSTTVALSMFRQRRVIIRATVLVTLAISFAVSTATFNATYRHQAEVDAQLTNGADVTVTESPGAHVLPRAAAALAQTSGVRAVQPLQHRYAYVGADLQDLYGIDTSAITSATSLQDAYFQGGSADQLLSRLAHRPDGILVSAETVSDFQLTLGDQLKLRLLSGTSQQYVTVVFHYVGIVNEFPTAPKDSFLVANASYIAARTGDPSVGAFLVDTGGNNVAGVAADLRSQVGTTAKVTDVNSARGLVGSSLTSVDLSGLTTIELGFAIVLAAAAGGLVAALGLTERRRSLAVAAALGANRQQLRGFTLGESGFVALAGLVCGALAGWGLSSMLVKVLTGVFDPPPAHLAVPWGYLLVVAASSAVAIFVASGLAIHRLRGHLQEDLREL